MTALEKENEDDPDMGAMIASELEALSNQLAELEEKLKLLQLPKFQVILQIHATSYFK